MILALFIYAGADLVGFPQVRVEVDGDQRGTKLRIPWLRHLALVPSQSLAGWDTSVTVPLWPPRSVPATVLGAFEALLPPLCPTTLGGRYYYCPDFLDLEATVKRGHRSGSRSHGEEGRGARRETQVCALDHLAKSHPHGASVFSLVKWSVCFTGHWGTSGLRNVEACQARAWCPDVLSFSRLRPHSPSQQSACAGASLALSAVRRAHQETWSPGRALSKLRPQFSLRYITFEPNPHWLAAQRAAFPVTGW